MVVSFARGVLSGTFNIESGFDGSTVYLIGTLNWGMSPSHRITQRGPFQDGDSDIDFRLDPRVLSLPFMAPASDIDSHFNLRNKLLKFFSPGNDTAQLQVLWDGNVQSRILEVKVVGGLTMDTDSKDYNVRGVIQLRAADPTWYDPTASSYQLTSTLFGTPTPYPKTYPVPYGADSVNKVTVVNLTSTWITYPVITAYGPLTDLTISDTRGSTIRFSTAIPAGTYVIINLKYGFKSAIDQAGVNRFAWLNIDSDIVDFALYPPSLIADGINTISVSATGTTVDSRVVMDFLPRYIGV